jgi:hypothetical protein
MEQLEAFLQSCLTCHNVQHSVTQRNPKKDAASPSPDVVVLDAHFIRLLVYPLKLGLQSAPIVPVFLYKTALLMSFTDAPYLCNRFPIGRPPSLGHKVLKVLSLAVLYVV